MAKQNDNFMQSESQELWSLRNPEKGTSWLYHCLVPVLALATTILLTIGISMIYSATIGNKVDSSSSPTKAAVASADNSDSPSSATPGAALTSADNADSSSVVAKPPSFIKKIYSATLGDPGNHFFYMQLVWIVVGLAACVLAVKLNLDYLYRYSHWGLLAAFLPLGYLTGAAIAVKFIGSSAIRFFPFAAAIKGAVRWFRFGPINIQPSEFAKVFLVIFLAAYYGTLPREKIKKILPGIIVPFGAAGIILGLILLGKDLSTTFVTAMMTVGIMFLAGVKFRYMLVIVTIGAIVGTAFIAGSPMRRDRIVAWQHPEEAKEGESYQLFRSQICLGVGNLTGKGFSKGYMKTYLPEPHTDFIVAVIGEELGFIGLLSILACYATMCACVISIGSLCRRREDLLLCNGIALLIAVQALVNIGVVSGAVPPTGVTAPFLSYGGSSLISLLFLLGLVINVDRRNYKTIWDEIKKLRCMPTGPTPKSNQF